MDEIDGLDALDGQIAALEQSLGGAQAVAAAFDGELRRLGSAIAETGGDMGRLSSGFSRGLRQSFDGLILDGRKLSDVLGGLAQSMLRTTYSAATPAGDGPSWRAGGHRDRELRERCICPSPTGQGFTQGRVMPFAHGGVVSGPVRLSDAGRHGADGRGRTRGDHAAVARRRRATGCADRGRRAAGAGRHERLDPGRRRVPPVAKPDRGAAGPGAWPRPAQPLKGSQTWDFTRSGFRRT